MLVHQLAYLTLLLLLFFYFADLFSLLSFHPGFGQVSEGNV